MAEAITAGLALFALLVIIAAALLAALAWAVSTGRLKGWVAVAIIAVVVALAGAGIWSRQPPDPCAVTGRSPAGDGWSPTASMAKPRYDLAAVVLANRRVLAVGGRGEYICGDPRVAELYDPVSGSWTATGDMKVARGDSVRAIVLSDGRVLVVGGENEAGAELYDPENGAWTIAGTMPRPNGAAVGAVELLDGRVLVLRGDQLGSAVLYDPAIGTWTAVESTADARMSGAALARLPEGKVLLAGGYGKTGAMPYAELFDPATGTWSATASMGEARAWPAVATLQDGRILVAGGTFSSTAEIYDPETSLWAPTASMSTQRAEPSVVVLPDGRVLVAGGSMSPGDPGTASAELYDATTGTWLAAGRLGMGRAGAAAVLLQDGRVLVVGGRGLVGDLLVSVSSAELFDPGTSE